MAGELIAGLGVFKTLLDTAKGLKDMNDAAVRAAVAVELQGKILAAYQEQATLIEKTGALEKEVTELKAWGAEKQRYELADLGKGFFAYVLKKEEEAGKQLHALCTNCYERGIKSILICSGGNNVHERTWDCPQCKHKVKCTNDSIKFLIDRFRNPPAR